MSTPAPWWLRVTAFIMWPAIVAVVAVLMLLALCAMVLAWPILLTSQFKVTYN